MKGMAAVCISGARKMRSGKPFRFFGLPFLPINDRISAYRVKNGWCLRRDGAQGKRETGESPVRSRHCKSGVHNQAACGH